MQHIHECVLSVHAKEVQKVPWPLISNLRTWTSLKMLGVQPRWAVWKPAGMSWVNLSGVNLLDLFCVVLCDWKLLDRTRQSHISIPPLPSIILHAFPWDHYLKLCPQLIFKAACNQPKATRLGFQTQRLRFGTHDGGDLVESSLNGQASLGKVDYYVWWAGTWKHEDIGYEWMYFFLMCLSMEAGEGGGELEGESIQMLAHSKAFLAVSSSRSLLH